MSKVKTNAMKQITWKGNARPVLYANSSRKPVLAQLTQARMIHSRMKQIVIKMVVWKVWNMSEGQWNQSPSHVCDLDLVISWINHLGR